jgi:hypothetical protein
MDSDDKYDCRSWSSGHLLPRNEREDNAFWDDILVAEGSAFTPDANSSSSEDAGLIFWPTKLMN